MFQGHEISNGIKNYELLRSQERLKISPKEKINNRNTLSLNSIKTLFIARKKALEEVKPYICLKFYYFIAEKIQQEERNLLKILNLETKKARNLKKYSFILDPNYFQQKFLKSDY